MNHKLSKRIASAFNEGHPWPEDRDRIVREAQSATQFSDLPKRTQDLINSLNRGKGGIDDEE